MACVTCSYAATITTQATVNDTRLQYKYGKVANSGQTQRRRLPGALIIGVAKCGTGALISFLGFHPSVRIARDEVYFFDTDSNYAKGLEWYRSRMPPSRSDQITI